MSPEQVEQFRPLVSAALAEDGAVADVTSMATLDTAVGARAELVARSGGVVAGLGIAGLAFTIVDSATLVQTRAADGELVRPGTKLAFIAGRARAILAAERVALNFLGRLSGIATLTRAFVDAVHGLHARICDTRKTTPGLRELERYAVRAGGGFNHRFNLSDAVLIKDNHLAALGSVARAVAAARANAPAGIVVEVECDTLEQVQAAVSAGADAVLLDNMKTAELRRAVAIASGRVILEASGGITLENVRGVAETGVDLISVGALTHSAPYADVALDVETGSERSQRPTGTQ